MLASSYLNSSVPLGMFCSAIEMWILSVNYNIPGSLKPNPQFLHIIIHKYNDVEFVGPSVIVAKFWEWQPIIPHSLSFNFVPEFITLPSRISTVLKGRNLTHCAILASPVKYYHLNKFCFCDEPEKLQLFWATYNGDGSRRQGSSRNWKHWIMLVPHEFILWQKWGAVLKRHGSRFF